MANDPIVQHVLDTTAEAGKRIEPTLSANAAHVATEAAPAAAPAAKAAVEGMGSKLKAAINNSDTKAGLGTIVDSGESLKKGGAAIAKRVKELFTGSGDKLGGVAGGVASASDAVAGKAASIVGGTLKGFGNFATKNPLIAAGAVATAAYLAVKNWIKKRDTQSDLDNTQKEIALKETQLAINSSKSQLGEMPDMNPDARASGYTQQLANSRTAQAATAAR